MTRFAGNLRYPKLVMLTAGLFLLDLVIPDLVPFVDEILLALMTLVFMSLKDRSAEKETVEVEGKVVEPGTNVPATSEQTRDAT